jgi:hypothetical protein
MAKVGRPTVMTEEVLRKLEEIFSLGGSDREATFYAGISMQSLYEYQKKNPEYAERKAALKEKPVLKARRTIVDSLDDPDYAFKYVERKKKDEFSLRSEVTGADGGPMEVSGMINIFDPDKDGSEPKQ